METAGIPLISGNLGLAQARSSSSNLFRKGTMLCASLLACALLASGCGSLYSDNEQIAFSRLVDDNWQVFVLEVDTGSAIQLTDDPSFHWGPRWSPDHKLLSYTGDYAGDREIMLLDPSGVGIVRQFTENDRVDEDPSWSPDGQQMAFTTDFGNSFELVLADLDGSGFRQVTQNTADDIHPTWSPSGGHIAFASDRDGDHEIMVLDVYSEEVREIGRAHV